MCVRRRLEIDETFAGRTINCPDCNRPLDPSPNRPEPTLTSGYALASFLLALVGAFTLVGTVLAVACGVVALGQIRRSPDQVGGKRFAQAGIVLGTIFTLVTGLAFYTNEFLRVDGLLRTLESAGTLAYPPGDEVDIKLSGVFDKPRYGTIRRPSPAWGQLPNRDPDKEKPDDLLLVNIWEDAYIVCLTELLEQQPDLSAEACRQLGQQRFLQSDLVARLMHRRPSLSPAPSAKERDIKKVRGTDMQEFVLDSRLGGVDWTFLARVARDGGQLSIVAGGTRSQRFERLRPEIVQALDSYKVDK